MLSRLITESYITEVSRWKKEVASGNLSPESIERIKKEGVAKTPEEYAAGLRKGSDNIAKQAGFEYDRSPMKFINFKNPVEKFKEAKTGLGFGNYYTMPNFQIKDVTVKQGHSGFFSKPKEYTKKVLKLNGGTIRMPDKVGLIHNIMQKKMGPNIKNDIDYELVSRHEANEAKYAKRNFEQYGSTVPMEMVKDNQLVGGHGSMNIIADEAKNVNFYNKLFGAGQGMLNKRMKTEHPILKDTIGVGYDDINFNNFKDVSKKISNYEKKYLERLGNYSKNSFYYHYNNGNNGEYLLQEPLMPNPIWRTKKK